MATVRSDRAILPPVIRVTWELANCVLIVSRRRASVENTRRLRMKIVSRLVHDVIALNTGSKVT